MLAASFVKGTSTFLFAVMNDTLQAKATAIIKSDQQMEIEFRREGFKGLFIFEMIELKESLKLFLDSTRYNELASLSAPL